MRTSINILIVFFFFTTAINCNRIETRNKEFKALGKFISSQEFEKLRISKYLVLEALSDSLPYDTIWVSFLKETQTEHIDTALLTLNLYKDMEIEQAHYTSPNNDAKEGIEKAAIDTIGFEYWQNCEMGIGQCIPLNFYRRTNTKYWFLKFPDGGTQSNLTIKSKNDLSFEKTLTEKDSPILEITKLKDGTYSANMIACGLGGQIEFNLLTQQ